MYRSPEDETPFALLLLVFPCCRSPPRMNGDVLDPNAMTHRLTSQPTPWVLFFPADPRAAMGLYNGGRV